VDGVPMTWANEQITRLQNRVDTLEAQMVRLLAALRSVSHAAGANGFPEDDRFSNRMDALADAIKYEE
jgi:hypothetical protein